MKGIKRQDTFIDEPIQSPNDAYVMFLVSLLNWVIAVVLPFSFLNSASKDGFPWTTHYIFGAYCLLIMCYELFELYRMEGFQYYFSKLTFEFGDSAEYSFGGILIPFNLLTGILARCCCCMALPRRVGFMDSCFSIVSIFIFIMFM